MSQELPKHPIQRIVVALDTSPGSLTALREAVTIAAGSGAELLGIFVEDINLVRVAQMSFTQEIGLFSATQRQLEIRYIERHFRGQADRMQRAMARLAAQAGVEWTFRTVRGTVDKELLSAASQADLIVLGRVGLSPLGRKRIGSTALALLLQSPHLTLVLHPNDKPGTSIIVLYDGSKLAQRAITATAGIAQNKTNPLIIFLLAEGPDEAERLHQQAKEQLKATTLTAQYQWHSHTDGQGLIHTIKNRDCQMVVVPSNGSALDATAIQSLLENLMCPILLVR